MRPETTHRDRTDLRPYLKRRITWRGLGAAYGLMFLMFAVVWAVSYPTVAATVFAFVIGTYVMIRISARIVHRRTRRTVCVPGIDVCVTI